MGESTLMTIMSVLLSIVFVEMLLPVVNKFFDRNIEFHFFSDTGILLFIFFTTLIVSVLTGFYPSILQSSFNPALVLKGTKSIKVKGVISFRNILVVIQFIIAQILIICTIIISSQMDYMKNKELGFDKEAIVYINNFDTDKKYLNAFRNELQKIPQIESLTMCMGAPTSSGNLISTFGGPGLPREEETLINFKPVDENYQKTFGFKILAGKWIEKPASENDSIFNIVVNQTVLKKLSIENPADALGIELQISGFKGKIVGVINDFHSQSLHNEISPVAFIYYADYFYHSYVKLAKGQTFATLEAIKKAHNKVYPDAIFEYEFYDDYFAELYEAEARTFNIIKVFSIVAILISVMGLIGLVSFIIAQRTKEIALRKVLGSSIGGIVILLSKEFTKWVLLAGIIAIPFSFYIMHNWLDEFAYRINIKIWMFVFAIVISLIISYLAVGWQAFRAARTNPVGNLRYE